MISSTFLAFSYTIVKIKQHNNYNLFTKRKVKSHIVIQYYIFISLLVDRYSSAIYDLTKYEYVLLKNSVEIYLLKGLIIKLYYSHHSFYLHIIIYYQKKYVSGSYDTPGKNAIYSLAFTYGTFQRTTSLFVNRRRVLNKIFFRQVTFFFNESFWRHRLICTQIRSLSVYLYIIIAKRRIPLAISQDYSNNNYYNLYA